MFNVFATPGDVFAEVKNARPATANWLIPLLLSILIGTISAIIIYAQPAIQQNLHEQQTKVFEDRVKAGSLTREQADQAEAAAEKVLGPRSLVYISVVALVVGNFLRIFWWALMLWLMGKWILKSVFPFQQALEVMGLASMILILGGIVTTLLVVCSGRFTALNLAIFAGPAHPQSPLYMILAAVDFFDLWLVAVAATGLARLADVPWSRAFKVTIIYWLIMEALQISLAWSSTLLSSGLK
jgi:hypothetical protein